MAGEWEEKIQRYVSLTTSQIKPNPSKSGKAEVALQAEGQKVLKLLNSQVCHLQQSDGLRPFSLPCLA